VAFASRAGRRQAALFTLLALLIMLPALIERHAFYRLNDAYLSRSDGRAGRRRGTPRRSSTG